MNSTEPEPLPRELSESVERLGLAIAKKAERDRIQPEPQPTAQIVQLDFWEDGKRAAPNAVFRSALFPALHPTQKENRRFLEEGVVSPNPRNFSDTSGNRVGF
jgi:hypothetical protein